MGTSSAPEFPYPGGTPGAEPADPVAGKTGHFAWSRWVKEFVKRLDRDSVKKSGDTMTGALVLKNGTPESQLRVDSGGTGMICSTALSAATPTLETQLATKGYVDTRVPLYFQVSVTGDATGWGPTTGLKAGAIVFSLVDVSSTPTTVPPLLNPSNNNVYVGPGVTRLLRVWYV